MKSVILVGNGPSVLKNENGNKIDNYDVVVRFSWYHIEGYEKYVGTKTNIWFTTVACPIRLKKEYDLIYEHSWQWNKDKDKNYKNILKSSEKIKEGKNLKKVERNILLEIQEYVDDKEYWTYSTGSIAIWILLKEYDKLTLTGFDWWEENDKHHYGDNQKIGTIHKPDKEFIFIKKLINDKKVNFL